MDRGWLSSLRQGAGRFTVGLRQDYGRFAVVCGRALTYPQRFAGAYRVAKVLDKIKIKIKVAGKYSAGKERHGRNGQNSVEL